MCNLTRAEKWGLHFNVDKHVDFCVWILSYDGLKVEPFSHHSKGNGHLQNQGLNEENWFMWFQRVIRSQDQRLGWHIENIEHYINKKEGEFALLIEESYKLSPDLMSSYTMESPNFREMALWQEDQFQEAKSLIGNLPSRYNNASELWTDDPEIKKILNHLWEIYDSQRSERTKSIKDVLSLKNSIPMTYFNSEMCNNLKALEGRPDVTRVYQVVYPHKIEFSVLPCYIIISLENGCINENSFCKSVELAFSSLIQMRGHIK